MNTEEDFTLKANKQLLYIIENMKIGKPKDDSLAFNGEKIVYSNHYLQFLTSGGQRLSLPHNIGCFNAKQIEITVLKHTKHKLTKDRENTLRNYAKYHSTYKCPKFNEEVWVGPREKSPSSLRTLALETLARKLLDLKQEEVLPLFQRLDENLLKLFVDYLIYDLKAPLIIPKDYLIENYIPVQEIPVYESHVQSVDENFRKYLAKNFPRSPGMYKSKKFSSDEIIKNLPTIKKRIEAYLNYGGRITLPLIYCILHDDTLFLSTDQKTLLESSTPFTELAEWLLHGKQGWCYLGELLNEIIKTVIEAINKKNSTSRTDRHATRFMRCLALIHNYHVFYDTQNKNVQNTLCEIAKAGEVVWLGRIIQENLITPTFLNHSFLLVAYGKLWQKHIKTLEILKDAGATNLDKALLLIAKKLKKEQFFHDDYYDAMNKLLDWGASPNVLFYRDKQGMKKCYLSTAWNKGTWLLMRTLLHAKRIRDHDEPSDFDYLKDRVLSVESIFDNGETEGQQDVYEYAMYVYELAFEALKTRKAEDMVELRQYIINRHKKYKEEHGLQKIINPELAKI